MGDLIPLFPQGVIRFTLTGDQRLRLEGSRRTLRFKDGEDVVIAALRLFTQCFNMRRGGWILVAVRGERTEDKLGDHTTEIDFYPSYTPNADPSVAKLLFRLLAIALQKAAESLLFFDQDASTSDREEYFRLEGKEYSIRCSSEWCRSIEDIQGIYDDAGWSATIDDIVTRALNLLANLTKKRSEEERTFYFQRGNRAEELLWDEFLDQFERTE